MAKALKCEREGLLARREKQLAFMLLMPAFLLVFLIVLLPLLANFWISLKPVTLADLRPPALIVKEKLRGELQNIGDIARLEYRYRNSSIKYPLSSVVFFDVIPSGLSIIRGDSSCATEGKNGTLICELGNLDPKARGKLDFDLVLNIDQSKSTKDFLSSVPQTQYESYKVLTSFDFTFDNFRKIFSASEFWEVLRISIYYTVFGTAGALIVGLFAAQIMQKTFLGRSFVRGLILFPYVAPVIAVAFSWVVLFDPFSGIVNALIIETGASQTPLNFFGQKSIDLYFLGISFSVPLALTMVILFEIWRYFPLSFLFIMARMQAIPTDIYEAAEIDGATPMQQFRFLSLPFIAGILAILFLLRFIWTFNKFDDIFLLTGGNAGTRTLTVSVYEQAFAISNLGAGAAVAVIIFIFLLLFAVVFIKLSPKDVGS